MSAVLNASVTLDSLGENVLRLVDFDSFSISTPRYVAVSIPFYTFSKILEKGKYRRFNDLMNDIQTSLFKGLIEKKPFPEIEDEKLRYLNETADSLLKAFEHTGCVAGAGQRYLVYVINVENNIRDIKNTHKEMQNEDTIRQLLFDGHKERVSEIVENTLLAVEKSFDDMMYV